MKYVVCVPDGCADEPLDALGGRTPLDVASMPTLTALARRGTVGRAAVIPCEHTKSYMWYRVHWCEMPFPGYPNCLDELEVATIARWIDQGGAATFDAATCEDPPLE